MPFKKKSRRGAHFKRIHSSSGFGGDTYGEPSANSDKYSTGSTPADQTPKRMLWTEGEDFPALDVEKIRLRGTYDANLKTLYGRRIVDISHFIAAVRSLESHDCHVDKTGYLAFKKETRIGLNSKLFFECTACGLTKNISTNPEHDVNILATWGTLAMGKGHYSLQENLSILDIPSFDGKTFYKYQQELGKIWHDCLTEAIDVAGREEYQNAIQCKNLTENGVGQCAVIVDGGWSHRSYGHKYTSQSGVACIIGAFSKKLLFLGVRNKYCGICAVAEKKQCVKPPHVCYKNWTGSSPAMEADILVEGFLKSETMHNLQYTTFIGDGDSSVHAKILEKVPYCRKIKKIECANHLTKNLKKHFHELAKESASNKKLLSSIRINYMGKSCRKLVSLHARKEEPSLEQLKADLLNVINHVFGDHKNCRQEFCLKFGQKISNENFEKLPTETRLRILRILGNFSSKSSSLIQDLTSNKAEQFMRQVAKFNNAKQSFYGRRNGFNIRCAAAGLAYQFGPSWLLQVYRKKFGRTPTKTLKQLVNKKLGLKSKQLQRPRRKLFTAGKKNEENAKDYGLHCYKPDMDSNEIKQLIKQQVNALDVTSIAAVELEQLTRGQNENPRWFEERKSRLTASTFGNICKRRANFGKLVEAILYKPLPQLKQLEYGKLNEAVAIEAYTLITKNPVTPCGLFISIEKGHGFLGASPDGLVGCDKIIEVKCPYSAREHSPLNAAKFLKNFCSVLGADEKSMTLKKEHNYFYQIQGQLYISNRKACDFVIWTPKGIYVETINRDDKFIKNMLKKLKNFYYCHYGVELVDSRHARNMQIRDYTSKKNKEEQ